MDQVLGTYNTGYTWMVSNFEGLAGSHTVNKGDKIPRLLCSSHFWCSPPKTPSSAHHKCPEGARLGWLLWTLDQRCCCRSCSMDQVLVSTGGYPIFFLPHYLSVLSKFLNKQSLSWSHLSKSWTRRRPGRLLRALLVCNFETRVWQFYQSSTILIAMYLP